MQVSMELIKDKIVEQAEELITKSRNCLKEGQETQAFVFAQQATAVIMMGRDQFGLNEVELFHLSEASHKERVGTNERLIQDTIILG